LIPAVSDPAGEIDLLLLAPDNVLVKALETMLVRSGVFDNVVHGTGPECLNGLGSIGICRWIVCVFLDNAKGLDQLRLCTSLLPGEVRIIAVCAADLEVGVMKKAVKEGARSLVCISSSFDELIGAIKRTALGEKVLSKQIESSLVGDIFNESAQSQAFTRREQQVLEMVCGGQTMKEIAYTLKLSPYTIQFYHRSVMEKVGVNRTADLIVYAMRYGLYTG
jgi:DNA-binding NarL/FixJ family response regulator